MKTLKLFNAVVAKPSNAKIHVSQDGYVIHPDAMWRKDDIVSYYEAQKLNGNDLNKSFYKSWEKVKNSSRFEQLVDQIIHYASTYGTNFQAEMYIPAAELDIPEDLRFKVVQAYSRDELVEKCLNMLRSGIALKKETILDIFDALKDELGYTITGKEGIKNKEAMIMIADKFCILPEDPVDVLRLVVYHATGDTLLIKNKDTIDTIKESNYDPEYIFNRFGNAKLATIFNRFKPIFLAFKKYCPSVINRISKMSKRMHKPMVENPLNSVTSNKLTKDDNHWLENATPYALFRALNACSLRRYTNTFTYNIRNGKSWTEETDNKNIAVCRNNYKTILRFMKSKLNMQGMKFFVPQNVEYALPTSEKAYVGNIPMGTKFSGERLAVGVYWENSWGAIDLDLSAVSVSDKIGWNTMYNNKNASLSYSGDITDAPNGAVEYLHASKGMSQTYLVWNNVYSGRFDCDYKIVVGQGAGISQNYMMDPNKVMVDEKTQSKGRGMVLGVLVPEGDRQSFYVVNLAGSRAMLSGNNQRSMMQLKAFYNKWTNSLSFREVVEKLGGEFVDSVDEADYNLSLDNLTKNTFVEIFDDTKSKLPD